VTEAAGINCANGGTKITSGLDNGDGGGTPRDYTLQSGEVDRTYYVCKGDTGATGATGPMGPSGDTVINGNFTNYGNFTSLNGTVIQGNVYNLLGSPLDVNLHTTALSDTVTILVPLLLVLLLVIWAERTKNPILYLLAIMTLVATIVGLWDGLAGYRTSLVVVLAFLAFRLYLTAKDVNALED
jgi:hypothetical protein